MATDYTNEKLLNAAIPIYTTEVSLSQHYETVRATVTGFNLAAVGAIAAFAQDGGNAIIAFLLILSVSSALLTLRLSHAHAYHFRLASKMRSIMARHDEKILEKLLGVRKEWANHTQCWGWLRHWFLWVALNFLAPLVMIFATK